MTPTPSVAILLSTFNGAKYLDELINSLLEQEDIDLHIIIRDDGSSDETKVLLSHFEAKSEKIYLLRNDFENLGPSESFHLLLKYAVELNSFEYFAFADQDDIWLPRKVIKGIEFIIDHALTLEEPILYASEVTPIAAGGNILKYKKESNLSFGYRNSLVENSAVGTTILLNSISARILIANRPYLKVSYDAWYYLVISYIGSTYFDKSSYILYRRHTLTHTKYSTGVIKKDRIFRFLSNRHHHFYYQVKFFRTSDLSAFIPSDKLKFLDDFLKGINCGVTMRFKYVLKTDFRRRNSVDDLILKTLLILNWAFKNKNLEDDNVAS